MKYLYNFWNPNYNLTCVVLLALSMQDFLETYVVFPQKLIWTKPHPPYVVCTSVDAQVAGKGSFRQLPP